MDDKVRTMVNNIEWLGHASFKLCGSKTIYIDPWKLPVGVGGDGDIVLVTHEHHDHCSPKDIKQALSSNGKVLMSESCKANYPGADIYTLPYMKHKVDGLSIYATAAYNINKKFHTKEMGHVGYIVTLDGVTIYHTGDCDAFPHMADLKCDILLVPVSGTYVMNPGDAVDACNMVKPQVAIPMHWGDADVIGTKGDAERFQRVAPCEVVILDQKR